MLGGPDPGRYEDAEGGAVQAELLTIEAIVDPEMAFAMGADEKLDAAAVGVLAAGLLGGNTISQEVTAGYERQVVAELADGEVAADAVQDPAHFIEADALDGAGLDGHFLDHAGEGGW
jgi:hypothetical protein